MTRTLAEAAREAAGCAKCKLAHLGRTQVVYGVGDPNADLMLIGEAPGSNEDRQGEPFVGPAGQLLNRVLSEIGLRREDVYIANVLMCRPPGNRDPEPDEIESCTPWLVEKISLIQPRVLVTLGNFATKFVLQTRQGITRMRGEVYPWHGRLVIPTFHPAAILHGGGEKSNQFGQLREDFMLAQRTLAEPAPRGEPPPLAEPATREEPPPRAAEPSATPGLAQRAEVVVVPPLPDEEQMELF